MMGIDELKPFCLTLQELTYRYNNTKPRKRLTTRELASRLRNVKDVTKRKTSTSSFGYIQSITIYEG